MNSKLNYFVDQGHTLRGVIHVGASDGEEVHDYKALGINILCFEPLKSAYESFKKNHPDVPCIPYGLGNKTGTRTLNVSAGDGKGSSTLKVILDHPEVVEKWNHGQAEVVGKQKAKFYRFDEWVERTAIDLYPYNCLVLDAQGMSLEVLEGFGKYLEYLDFLVVELSATPVYKGEKPAQEVIDWLAERDFVRMTEVHPHDDVLFIRKRENYVAA